MLFRSDRIGEALAARGDARAVLLTGAGKAFCSGADISGGEIGPDTVHRALVDHFNPLFLTLADLPIPIVSAVRGAAAGIGCSLALAADFCVASEGAFSSTPSSISAWCPTAGQAGCCRA